MEQKVYLISDAAKQVQVESHVLRYWEDELELPIKRNQLGHRYYTAEDVSRLKRVKAMKEQGFQLKAIRRALQAEKQGQTGFLGTQAQTLGRQMQELKADEKEESGGEDPEQELPDVRNTNGTKPRELSGEDKSYRLRMLLKNMMLEAIREGNEEFAEEIKESVLKELDYQFRAQEEREDEREQERLTREEEHYRQLDALLREKAEKKEKKDKKKKRPFF